MNNRTHATQTMATSNEALELALHKIASVEVPQGKHIALAYSGGLDSTLCVKLSQLKYHPDIRSIKSASFNQKECAPAAHIRGLPYELIARRNQMAGIFSEGAQS